MDTYKIIYYIAGVLILHYMAGWVAPILFTALASDLLIRENSVLKATFIGLLINVGGVVLTIFVYPEESWRMMHIVNEALVKISPYVIPVFSILVPTSLYALAAYFNEKVCLAFQDLKNIN